MIYYGLHELFKNPDGQPTFRGDVFKSIRSTHKELSSYNYPFFAAKLIAAELLVPTVTLVAIPFYLLALLFYAIKDGGKGFFPVLKEVVKDVSYNLTITCCIPFFLILLPFSKCPSKKEGF
jgi:hypothetical protein